MKKVELTINETLKYERKMEIEIPDKMTEDELNQLLNNVESKHPEGASDVSIIIQRLNKDIKITSYSSETYQSPYSSDVEIEDFEIIE